MKIRYLLSIFLFCCFMGATGAMATKPVLPLSQLQNPPLADTDSLPTSPIVSGRLLMNYLQSCRSDPVREEVLSGGLVANARVSQAW